MTPHKRPDCPRTEALSGLIDGELAPAAKELVAAHAATCPLCGAMLRDLTELRAALRPFAAARVGFDLAPLVEERLTASGRPRARKQSSPPAPHRWREWRLVPAGLAAAGMLASGIYLGVHCLPVAPALRRSDRRRWPSSIRYRRAGFARGLKHALRGGRRMKRSGMQLLLVLSLAFNLGTIGAVAYRAVQHGELPGILGGGAVGEDLVNFLKLNPEQREQWHALEGGFLRELEAEWQQMRAHRETLIREIFSDHPDRSLIERERVAIAQLQAKQQQAVIEQLLRERDILDPAQRRELAELLVRQAPAAAAEARLHGK